MKSAKDLGTRALFTEREGGRMRLRRGFAISPGREGARRRRRGDHRRLRPEVMDVVAQARGELVGVGLLVDRSGGRADFGVRTEALLHLEVEAYLLTIVPSAETVFP